MTDAYTYGPYGETVSPSGSPYRFTGRRLDAETGLYYYRARYYSPVQGRFLSPDPIGYGDGMNMYAYVGNDPINFVDPSGLAAEGAANLGKKTWNYASNNPLETFHYAMDGGGMTPVVGIFADALNAVVYTGEAGYHAVTGDFGRAGSAIGNAGISAAAMVPVFGQGATAAKYAGKAASAGAKNAQKFGSQRAAFRAAKRDAGIPTSQTHLTHTKNLKADRLDTHRTATEYDFGGGRKIQNHPAGHKFSDGSVYNKPHFNNHGKGGTKGHYEY